MKKSLVSALTTAMVVGAASTTFAAANPFSDVPADHWAYDAVAQLAAEGVVEGYGDGSFRGQQEITRYEMAQMVAKAMAKGVNSAALDKLAAEFADELNSLGVRVANLEKKVDNVKFTGEMRWNAARTLKENKSKSTVNYIELRLKMAAQVNKNWTVKSRFDYRVNPKTSENAGLRKVYDMYAQGKYGKATIDLGKFDFYESVSEGMLFDDTATGIQVGYAPSKSVNIGLVAGRVSENTYFGSKDDADTATKTGASMWGAKVELKGKKLFGGVAYYNFRSKRNGVDTQGLNDYVGTGKDKANVWAYGIGYKFDKNVRLYGTYARNSGGDISRQKKAYNIQLDYKGMNVAKRGTYGLHLAYKHLGTQVVTNLHTYNIADRGMKGWEISGEYALDKNIGLYLGYFKGKMIGGDKEKTQVLWSRVRFFF